jgi:hypothetical protein
VSGTRGGNRVCVSTAFHNEGTENRVFQNYYRTSKGPLVLTAVSDSNTSNKKYLQHSLYYKIISSLIHNNIPTIHYFTNY